MNFFKKIIFYVAVSLSFLQGFFSQKFGSNIEGNQYWAECFFLGTLYSLILIFTYHVKNHQFWLLLN